MPIAAFLGIAVVGLIMTSWLTDREAVRRSVESQLRAATGLDLAVTDADVSLFPGSYVTLGNVTLKNGDEAGPALSVDHIVANLRLVPLLMHRVEIADVTLEHPRVNVVRDAEGHSNWTPIVETLVSSLKSRMGDAASFSEIRIHDGAMAYRDEARHAVETVSDADMSFAWPSISRSFAATGQFDWRGKRIDGSLIVSDFVAALSGERSGLKARFAGTPVKFAFDGAIAGQSSLMLDGTLTADAPSLREALRWAGHELPGTDGFGRFSLKAKAAIVGASIALTKLNMEIDRNITEGALTYSNDKRQSLQATLAADAIDITAYAHDIRLLARGAHEWSRQPFDFRTLAAIDLDIRLSAAKVTAGNSRFGRTAIGANLHDGVLALSIGEAQVFGGLLQGFFGLTSSDMSAAEMKAKFQFADIDLEALGADLVGDHKLAGQGNLNIALNASGSSAYDVMQSLDGTATLSGHDGALIGFDVAQLLHRLERRPLSGAGEFRSGRTPFTNLTVALKFEKGVASIDDAHIEGPSARLTLTGTTTIPTREYDMKGVASLVSAPDTPPAFELPFLIQGPWDDPLIFPDSDALIRRSPASAPLLNAVRDSRTRDAVRSVIERFKGVPKPAPDVSASPSESPAAPSPPANAASDSN